MQSGAGKGLYTLNYKSNVDLVSILQILLILQRRKSFAILNHNCLQSINIKKLKSMDLINLALFHSFFEMWINILPVSAQGSFPEELELEMGSKGYKDWMNREKWQDLSRKGRAAEAKWQKWKCLFVEQ